MGNKAWKVKKKHLLIKLKHTAICKVVNSQGKIIRKEINNFEQIWKRKKSIKQFEDEKNMKRETHQFAKGRKNKWRNKYDNEKEALGRHIEPPIPGPVRWVGFGASRLIRARELDTQRTWYKQFVKQCLLAVASCHPSQRPSGAAETPLGC